MTEPNALPLRETANHIYIYQNKNQIHIKHFKKSRCANSTDNHLLKTTFLSINKQHQCQTKYTAILNLCSIINSSRWSWSLCCWCFFLGFSYCCWLLFYFLFFFLWVRLPDSHTKVVRLFWSWQCWLWMSQQVQLSWQHHGSNYHWRCRGYPQHQSANH